MKERWIEDLRERFADRKTPPPDGLWESIESAMAAKGVATQKHEGKRRPITVALWRAATAAACVAAVAGAGWLLMRNGGDTAARIVRALEAYAASDAFGAPKQFYDGQGEGA